MVPSEVIAGRSLSTYSLACYRLTPRNDPQQSGFRR